MRTMATGLSSSHSVEHKCRRFWMPVFHKYSEKC
jgi:hypothetical protein